MSIGAMLKKGHASYDGLKLPEIQALLRRRSGSLLPVGVRDFGGGARAIPEIKESRIVAASGEMIDFQHKRSNESESQFVAERLLNRIGQAPIGRSGIDGAYRRRVESAKASRFDFCRLEADCIHSVCRLAIRRGRMKRNIRRNNSGFKRQVGI